MSFLIVEDSNFIREMLRMALGSRHLIYLAVNLEEGWSLFQSKRPDMIFMDVGPPDGNGHELANQIKMKSPSTFIVMATARRHVDDKIIAARNHADGFIGKPFNKKDITDVVERFTALR